MTSLLDISPMSDTVVLRGVKNIPINGVGADGVVYLLNRFPVLRAIMTGQQLQDLTMPALIALAPDAVDAIIAVGFGFCGQDDEKQKAAEARAHMLGIDEQIMCLEKILEMTMPRGVGPFVEMMRRLGSKAAASGWDQAMKSLEPSSSVSQTDTRPSAPGDTPRENSQDGSPSRQDAA